jgi:hypothetical protein
VELIGHRPKLPSIHIVREYELPEDSYASSVDSPGMFVKTLRVEYDNYHQHDVASLQSQVTIEWTDLVDLPSHDFCYGFNIYAPTTTAGNSKGKLVKSTTLTPLKVPSPMLLNTTNDTATQREVIVHNFQLREPKLWSTQTPSNLYEMEFNLYYRCEIAGDTKARLVDSISVHHGIRTLKFDPRTGFYLNSRPFKIRGFCDHDTFAVVGMALPDRINLFRVRMGNKRRIDVWLLVSIWFIDVDVYFICLF